MEGFRGLRDLPREIWVLFTAMLVNRMGTMAIPFLPIYLTKELHLSVAQSGFVIGCFGFGGLIAGPFAGWASDKMGAILQMRVALFSSALVMASFPRAGTYGSAILLTILLAISEESFRPACMAMIGDWVPPEQRRLAFAASRLFVNLGMSLGPLLGGILALHSLKLLFWVNATTTFGASLLLAFAKKPPKASHAEIKSAPKYAWGDRRLLYFSLALVPALMVFFQHESSLPVYMIRELGFKPSSYGLLFTINTALIILFELPLTAKTANWSYRSSLILGSLFISAGFGILSFTKSAGPMGFLLSVILWTFGEMFVLPSGAAYVDHIAPPGKRGAYMGVYGASFNLAFILGPWAGLHIYDYYGPGLLWLAAFVLGSLSAVLFLRLRGDKIARTAEENSFEIEILGA
jgi:MFS family permease